MRSFCLSSRSKANRNRAELICNVMANNFQFMRSRANIDTFDEYTSDALNIDSALQKLKLYSFCRQGPKLSTKKQPTFGTLRADQVADSKLGFTSPPRGTVYSRNEVSDAKFLTIDETQKKSTGRLSPKKTAYQQSFHRSLLRDKKKLEDSMLKLHTYNIMQCFRKLKNDETIRRDKSDRTMIFIRRKKAGRSKGVYKWKNNTGILHSETIK